MKKKTPPKIFFITYNESYSGIYQSQIIDVARYFENNFNNRTKIICLAPLKLYFQFRRRFKEIDSTILVLPSFPKIKLWKFNSIIIGLYTLFSKPFAIIARNPIAANIALELKKFKRTNKVCFDARGAFGAEFKEYLTSDSSLQSLAVVLEKTAITNADYSIIVTQKLLELYQKNYRYSSQNNVIIPTTLDVFYKKTLPPLEQIKALRSKYNLPNDSIIIAFSGGNADWQSFKMIDDFLVTQMTKNNKIFALLLTKTDLNKWELFKKFPNNFHQTFVSHQEVFELLSVCDYGLLLREMSITNSVASPTKCAEYLACGLPVIINNGIGDYSEFIHNNNLGIIYKNQVLELESTSIEKRQRMQKFANENFFKDSTIIHERYKKLLINLNSESSI